VVGLVAAAAAAAVLGSGTRSTFNWTLHLHPHKRGSAMQETDKTRLLILYGSQTGNAQVGRAGWYKQTFRRLTSCMYPDRT
jgi:sulfite reductase alpha subunit-like flavoprotein